MKLITTLLLLSSSFLATTSLPLPTYPGPQLHTIDTTRPSENALFLSRWQSNFGNRLTKPTSGILTIPADIQPSTFIPPPALIPSTFIPNPLAAPLPVPPGYVSPTGLHSHLPLDPITEKIPYKMHGALGFLKPKPKPKPKPELEEKAPAAVLPEPGQALFGDAGKPIGNGAGTKSPVSIQLPPNTMTKTDLLDQILTRLPQECPECGKDPADTAGEGWGKRFAEWIKSLWEKLLKALNPGDKGPAEDLGVWQGSWRDGGWGEK